jgi:hypothetical protein
MVRFARFWLVCVCSFESTCSVHIKLSLLEWYFCLPFYLRVRLTLSSGTLATHGSFIELTDAGFLVSMEKFKAQAHVVLRSSLIADRRLVAHQRKKRKTK